jgi:hypothetical protein
MNSKRLAVSSALALALVLGLVILSGSRSTTKAALAICSVPSGTYPTIQSAVNDVNCFTINVGSGTYNEQVAVTRSDVTITGAGAGSTIIQPSTVTANTSSLFSGSPIAAIVLVDGATGVTVEDLTVDGSTAAPNGCAPTYVGIFYRAGSGVISDTHVTNIFNPAVPGCQGFLGIFVQSGNGGPNLNANVVIDSNTVDNYGKNGITANEAGTSVTITNNTVTGRGPIADNAQNGVQLGFGAHGKVTNNTISDNNYTPESFVACGMLAVNAGGSLGQTKTSTFSGNEQNVCTAGNGPSVNSPFNR